jgi:glutamate-ammonia-ligase adenylyltransferase
MVVVGMGKLGGGELNFSSDIDLIFAYPDAENNGTGSMGNAEFFTRLSRSLIRVLGEKTEDGFVFRTDIGLRPFGETGEPATGFDAMERYYQEQGREWERYAWVKARVVAGDRAAGESLLKRLKPFIYRRYLDFGAFASLRDMKGRIEAEVRRKGLRDDVKLGPGGIREIEFFGQVFQLIRGGVSPVLQERSILRLCRILARENLVPEGVARELSEAYRFLRVTENRLQEHGDRQTHRLPAEPAARARLAAAMGSDRWEPFYEALERHRKNVHRHFGRLLGSPQETPARAAGEDSRQELEQAWLYASDAQKSKRNMEAARIGRPEEAAMLLSHLRNDPAIRSMSRDGRERLDRLIPLLLAEYGGGKYPVRSLGRILDLIRAVAGRPNYLSLLLENPAALSHLVRFAHLSPMILSFLTRHPVLLDELLDPRRLYSPPDRQELEKDLRHRLSPIPQDDLEYRMEALAIFKQANTLRVAAADVTEVLPLMKVSDRLTWIAETVLDEVLQLSWNHLSARHGKPSCGLSGLSCEPGFAVIAYGKLGGLELGYDSDLDLVFVHAGLPGQTAGGKIPMDNAQFFARLGQRVIHILTTHTPAGALYETDMRLRPSGSSGMLVCHMDAFLHYQTNTARTWEHQALIRARPVAGDRRIAERFEEIRQQVLAAPRDPDRLRQEVSVMCRRLREEHGQRKPGIFDIKYGAGGMLEIEFLVQYLTLLHAHRHRDLLRWTDNVRLLETLSATGIVENDTAHFLKEAYLAYRSRAHRLSLRQKPARIAEPGFADARRRVSEIWEGFMKDA